MGKIGVLVISHGSRSSHWVGLVDEAVQAAILPDGVPIYSAFLEIVEGRLIQNGIDALEADGVTELVVIPLFVSSGSTHLDEIQYALGVIPQPKLETDLEPFRVQARVHFGVPLDEDPDVVGQMLYDQIRELSSSPDSEKVLVIGHGSAEDGFHQKWRQGLDQAAERLRALGGFAQVEGAMLLPDQTAEYIGKLVQDGTEAVVLVAPFFLSAGYFTEQVIPKRLAGIDYRYNGRAMLPHPLVSEWLGRQVEERIHRLVAEKV